MEGLTDRPVRLYRHASRLPFQVEKLIVRMQRTGGIGKLRRQFRH
jgi:hypothetical protein